MSFSNKCDCLHQMTLGEPHSNWERLYDNGNNGIHYEVWKWNETKNSGKSFVLAKLRIYIS